MQSPFHEKIHYETVKHIADYLSSHGHDYDSSLLVQTDTERMVVWYEKAAPLLVFHMQAEGSYKHSCTGRFTFTLANPQSKDVSYKYENNLTKGIRKSDIYTIWKVYMTCRDHTQEVKRQNLDDYDFEWNRDKYCS